MASAPRTSTSAISGSTPAIVTESPADKHEGSCLVLAEANLSYDCDVSVCESTARVAVVAQESVFKHARSLRHGISRPITIQMIC